MCVLVSEIGRERERVILTLRKERERVVAVYSYRLLSMARRGEGNGVCLLVSV